MPGEGQKAEKEIVVAPQEAVPGQREQETQEMGHTEVEKGFAVARQESEQLNKQIAETEAFAAQERDILSEVGQETTPELAQIRQETEMIRIQLDALDARKAALDAELGTAPPAPEAETPAKAAVAKDSLDIDTPDDDESGDARKKTDEKEGEDAGKKREQMEAMTREMKEKARQAFETTVSPALRKIREAAASFSDLPDDVRELVAEEMKQGERFFTMDDCKQSLSAREVGNLEKLVGNLRSARNGKEFAKIYTNETLADIHDFAFPNMWPHIVREDWDMLAQRGMNERAGEKTNTG